MKQQVAVEPISGALNKHKVQPVLVLGAGITADYAAQRLSSAHKIVQIKWGPVADLPLDWLLKQEALEKGRQTKGKPTAVIAKTVKGKGCSFMENKAEWHGVAPSAEEVEKALAELA